MAYPGNVESDIRIYVCFYSYLNLCLVECLKTLSADIFFTERVIFHTCMFFDSSRGIMIY